ncbi:integrase [Streptomyces sp. GD-15H]|uniref:integrase n=1 Tax=Streptomyces sp. GD-15H TaxID=3129112 RepID=UPI0038738332
MIKGTFVPLCGPVLPRRRHALGETPALHRYLRLRNAHARRPDVLAAQRKERARIRNEKGIRWIGRPLAPAV